MSRNAVVPSGRQVPLWDELGRALAGELENYSYAGPLDAISAYAHEFGRPRMIERVAEALLIEEATPGEAHRAFCSIPFDTVCTTNVDFLLERQYEATPRYCRPIIDEDHLVVNHRSNTTALLKLHGDLHHPARLVLTEEDYDTFLDRYPLLSTYVANLLITRTAVLVGYSLDDPDFRQLWQVIGERLGKARRLAYTIMVGAQPTEVARFARRGVKVISLPGRRSNYGQILAAVFDELREYMQTHLLGASHVTEEEPLRELSLPQAAVTRLCFFSLPLSLQPQYRDQVFPLAERAGLVPVTAEDVIAPGDNYSAKIDAIISRSVAAVVDLSTPNALLELETLLRISTPSRILVVVDQGAALPTAFPRVRVVRRSMQPIADQPAFLEDLENWFRLIAAEIQPRLEAEPLRLLEAREYRAAVISAMTHLESLLRSALDKEERFPGRAYSMRPLAELAVQRELLTPQEYQKLRDWIQVRNMVVHSERDVTKARATEIVKGVLAIATRLRERAL